MVYHIAENVHWTNSMTMTINANFVQIVNTSYVHVQLTFVVYIAMSMMQQFMYAHTISIFKEKLMPT